ncbi:MAG: glycosyltransferase family protein [Desulfobaccales bacterium]
MARILYGVQGSGTGHAVRALTVARRFPEHEFLFVSFGSGAQVLKAEYPVAVLPAPDTVYRRHRLVVSATVIAALRYAGQDRLNKERLLRLIDAFQPEVALSDYDYLVPWASRRLGLPCLGLDHQHVITCCRHRLPPVSRPAYWVTSTVIRRLYGEVTWRLVTSFFHPPLRNGVRARLVPPLLRESVLKRQPTSGEHVVAYQSVSTFRHFLPFLRSLPRPVYVYGLGERGQEGNLHFRPRSEEGFLDDLASCAYVVAGGGHTAISEALYFGKPVLSFPIRRHTEQFLNAYYLDKLGYGMRVSRFRPGPGLWRRFERRLADFAARIREGSFVGNEEIFARVAAFIDSRGRHLGGEDAP